MATHYSAVVIGGGYYGCYLAIHLARSGGRVLVLEAEDGLLARASYKNQARVHNGYHYPRDRMTALRSHQNFRRFVEDHGEGVVVRCEAYYAIARELSKVSARSFETMFRRIGAPLDEAPARIRRLFDSSMIEEVFAVQEYTFDASKLRELMLDRLEQAGVELRLREPVRRVSGLPGGGLAVETPRETVAADDVYNCTYSGLNEVLRNSDLPEIPLKHELAEVALVRPPAALEGVGVTVMCGPFFSTIPFPARGLHSLTHVTYTPRFSWTEGPEESDRKRAPLDPTAGPPTTFAPRMLRHASQFMPVLAESQYVDSLWQTKTVLPRNEKDDGRPILFRRDCGLPGLHCVLGAKLDNIYDLFDEVDRAARAGSQERLTV